jgi:hypothetical protein
MFKILEDQTLSLEIYSKPNSDGTPNMIQKISLAESRDAYFSFMGNATNLALSDTDQNGTLDILAPTYDDQMTARLHLFEFNTTTQKFDRKEAPNPIQAVPTTDF